MRYYLTVKRDCEHVCSGNCRREGCNCECGEFHLEKDTLLEIDSPSLDYLLEKVGAWERANV